MAKKKAAKARSGTGKRQHVAVQAEDAEKTSYSTRFTAAQRKIIEEAAGVLGCTPAKLIREASVERAAHVVNMKGDGRAHAWQLAQVLVNQLLNPRVQFRRGSVEDWTSGGQVETVERSYREYVNMTREAEPPEAADVLWEDGVKPLRPPNAVLEQIKEALATCGTEFTRYMLQQWREEIVQRGHYEARVRPEEFLGGDDGE